jgi:hypothetical protein
MNQKILLALVFLSLSLLSQGLEQRDSLSVSAGELTKFVSVTLYTLPSQLLPGMEYSKSVSAEWAIPQESLSGLEASEVSVFVTLESNSSQVYFKNGAQNAQTRDLQLSCVIKNGYCSNESILSRSVRYYAVSQGNGVSATIFVRSRIVTPDFEIYAPIQQVQVTQAVTGTNGASQNASVSATIPGADLVQFVLTGNKNNSTLDSELENAGSQIVGAANAISSKASSLSPLGWDSSSDNLSGLAFGSVGKGLSWLLYLLPPLAIAGLYLRNSRKKFL